MDFNFDVEHSSFSHWDFLYTEDDILRLPDAEFWRMMGDHNYSFDIDTFVPDPDKGEVHEAPECSNTRSPWEITHLQTFLIPSSFVEFHTNGSHEFNNDNNFGEQKTTERGVEEASAKEIREPLSTETVKEVRAPLTPSTEGNTSNPVM